MKIYFADFVRSRPVEVKELLKKMQRERVKNILFSYFYFDVKVKEFLNKL